MDSSKTHTMTMTTTNRISRATSCYQFFSSLIAFAVLHLLLGRETYAWTFAIQGAVKPIFASSSLPRSYRIARAAGTVNGDAASIVQDGMINVTTLSTSTTNSSATGATITTSDELMGLTQAPQLSFDKYMTMQDKRVVVTIRYSGDSGLKPYFLTVAKKLKASHPDVMIERRILADVEVGDEEPTFEVLVDGRIVLGRGKKQKAVDMSKARSVFVSMQELDLAISRARRRRRPATAYGGGSPNNDAVE